ncbi:TRIB2 isoform 3 [Pan troglodytes]|uniref:Tribbles homolog 2 n=3 Tax=Pan TaxID=9596 RepID=A0A2I3SXM6_PANTR|nr:TRIB2 isoform 3 [Pan troglodytes]
MNIHRSTPITIARYGRSRNKTQDFEELSSIRSAEPSQSFSPNLGSPSPPETPNLSHCVSCIGKYLLLEPLEGDHVFRAVHLHSGEELVCKVFDISCYQESLAPCFCLSAHSNINQITEIILGETKAYVFFERSYGDMHSFVRTCKKLREEEAARLFYQIASAVAHCHDGGLVLRDLKLRKFIFKDEERCLCPWSLEMFPLVLPLIPSVISDWSFVCFHPPSTSLIFLLLLPSVCCIGSKVFSINNKLVYVLL